GHVPARRPQAHGGRVQLRPQPRAQHHPQRRQAGKRALLRAGRPRRHHGTGRLGMLRQMGVGGAPWDAHDLKVAQASMASEARLLRNHPSVIGFLIGSDNAPPPALAKMYVDTLQAEDWPTPIIAAAVDQATAETGPSGMKMTGPYAWVPPSYWYADKLGGAFGFNSETSAGADIPRLEDLTRMLSSLELETLWKHPQLRQYHAAADWSTFASIAPFDTALAKRYGAPKSLADYVAKAQLDNYDNTRAQFEAFNAHRDAANPSTGVIYWMLNNAWPSLHWHLYD